nr:EamA family transporter [Devosia aurantiaca]
MPIRHVLLALLVVAIWGFNFVVIKLSVEALPPILAAALRFSAAAIPAALFVKPPKTKWWIVVAYGISFGSALYALLNLSIAWGMPAGLSSIVLQTQAFFTMLMAFLILGERPSRFQILGAAIAFGGIMVIASERIEGAGLLPLSLTLLAAISWGLANVLTKKAGRVSALSFTVWGRWSRRCHCWRSRSSWKDRHGWRMRWPISAGTMRGLSPFWPIRGRCWAAASGPGFWLGIRRRRWRRSRFWCRSRGLPRPILCWGRW